MARIIDESFEGTGYEESWTESSGQNATNYTDQDSAIPGTAPAGAGSQCLRLLEASGGWAIYTTRTLASDITIGYYRVYFNIHTSGLTSNSGLDYGLMCLHDSSNAATAQITIINTDSQHYARFSYHAGGGWAHVGARAISLDTWYRAEIMINNTADTYEWRLYDMAGNAVGGAWTTGSVTLDRGLPRAVRLGFEYADSSARDYYFDLVAVDDADWVGAEGGEEPAATLVTRMSLLGVGI